MLAAFSQQQPKLLSPPAAELSRIIRLDEITQTPTELCIKASAEECAALAARFDLPGVRALEAEITYRRTKNGNGIKIDGTINARFQQICCATLEKLNQTMTDEAFSTEYTLSAWEKFSEFDLEQAEVLTDDFIDLGEVIAQYFCLELNPYPEKPMAERLQKLADETVRAAQKLQKAQAARQAAANNAPIVQGAGALADPSEDRPFFRFLKQMQNS